MRLSDVLREDAILLDIKGIDKWMAIERLTSLLVESAQIEPQRQAAVLEALLARERSMSTGMENGIAIPHCSVDSIDHTLISIGISPEGIEFDSIDGTAARLIFLLVTPKNRTKDHIKTLAEIAKLLSHEAFRQRLLASTSASEVLEATRQEEQALG
ncbi:MAG: PTS sugar transporter subunit IIA [Planctomycetota bacterium]